MSRTAIVGVGAFTSLGLTSLQTAFVLRTGMPGFAPCALADENGEAVTFGLLPTVDPALVGTERAAEIAAPALAEACMPLRPFADQLRVGVVLAVDEWLSVKDTWGAANPAAEMIRAIDARARQLLPHSKVTPVARGAAGPAFVLPDAIAALEAGSIDALVFGGVHTDYEPARIRAIEAQGRLFSPNNLDALIPGEAAAFVTLLRADVARRAGLEIFASIESIGGGFEKANPDNDESAYEAKGLTTAFRAATKPLVDDKRTAGWILGDLTFEMWRLSEWQAAITRTRTSWGEPYTADNPAQRLGHLGAAALPLLIAYATEGFRRGFAPSPTAVAFAGSDAGERAALVLSDR